MTPVNLAALPSNQPAPTGLCQIKRGGAETSLTYNNSIEQGRTMHDGTGVPLQISITPDRPGWWVVRAETIWNQVEAVWMYFAWFIGLNVNDADGQGWDWAHNCQHSAQGWQESCIDAIYRLNAGVTYTCRMAWGYSQGYNQQQYVGKDYTYIFGEFVGEGQI